MTNNDSIESLFVDIQANIEPLLTGAKKGVRETTAELGKFERQGKKAFDETGQSAGNLGQAINVAKGFLVSFLALFAFQRVAGFFKQMAGGVISVGSQFEKLRTQFATLLGSQGAAQQRIDQLAEFNLKTPFTLDEVAAASKTLQTFGGSTLATTENLTLVGDSAAAVGAELERVSFWTGRLYSMMQSGRPFGEAAMNLQEMGIMTAEARNELEAMQKAGASGPELWARYAEITGGRFAGAMEDLSKTFEGVMSNLEDLQSMLLLEGGEEFFEGVRDDAGKLYELLSRPDIQQAQTAVAAGLGAIATKGLDLVSSKVFSELSGLDARSLNEFAKSLERISLALGKISSGEQRSALKDIVETFTILNNASTTLTGVFDRMAETTNGPLANGIKGMGLGLRALFPQVRSVTEMVGMLSDKWEQLTGKRLGEGIGNVSDLLTPPEAEVPEEEPAPGESSVPGIPDPETVEDTADRVKELLLKAGAELAELQEKTETELETSASEHNDKLIEIESEYVQARLALGEKLADDLEALDAEVVKRRAEIFADTRSALAQVEADTNQALQDERQDFQQDELRQTEDHLRRLRDIRAGYLSGLEEAVANRDARAIVDLRKRFQEEQARETENFTVQQDRRQEDQSQRLAEIRDRERRESDEIMQAQQTRLAELRVFEQERSAEIQQRFNDDLAQLDSKHNQELAKEKAAWEAKQAELNSALDNRLAELAQQYAAELELTEEQAQEVLSRLNEFYGEEGSITNLYREFAQRRAALLALTGEEEEPELPSTTSTGPGGRTRHIPGFASGGEFTATRPTLIAVGEGFVPEKVSITPVNGISTNRTEGAFDVNVNFSGVPSHIDQGQMEEIVSKVMVGALRQAGMR